MRWWEGGVWLACGPAPPRALTLTLSRRAGEGMFVADECTLMMGMWLFGWQGRFETCPYVGRIASMERVGCCGG